jgi:NADPH-dependent curcumin reductase CurA
MVGNRQIVLVRRPEGMVDESCFAESDGDIPSPGAEEILVRTRYLTIDPAIRGWLPQRVGTPGSDGCRLSAVDVGAEGDDRIDRGS